GVHIALPCSLVASPHHSPAPVCMIGRSRPAAPRRQQLSSFHPLSPFGWNTARSLRHISAVFPRRCASSRSATCFCGAKAAVIFFASLRGICSCLFKKRVRIACGIRLSVPTPLASFESFLHPGAILGDTWMKKQL